MEHGSSGVHLWLVLWKATRAVEAQAHKSIQALGLCLSDFGTLEALLHKGPLPVNVLARKVLLTSGSMTAAVDRLEEGGWVERKPNPRDRRGRVVHLTGKGRRLTEKAFALHKADMEHVFSALPREERSTLVALLRKLGQGAEKLRE